MASAPVISAAAMRRGMLRYESRAGAGPMHTSSSAKRTCSDSRSASEYTATVCTPSSRQARMTRNAISPRLAMRTFLNNVIVPRDQDCESDSNDDQLLSLVPATPCTRSANSLGLVAKKTALSYEMMPSEYQRISDWSKLCIPY